MTYLCSDSTTRIRCCQHFRSVAQKVRRRGTCENEPTDRDGGRGVDHCTPRGSLRAGRRARAPDFFIDANGSPPSRHSPSSRCSAPMGAHLDAPQHCVARPSPQSAFTSNRCRHRRQRTRSGTSFIAPPAAASLAEHDQAFHPT